jgi:hypothetical protein
MPQTLQNVNPALPITLFFRENGDWTAFANNINIGGGGGGGGGGGAQFPIRAVLHVQYMQEIMNNSQHLPKSKS